MFNIDDTHYFSDKFLDKFGINAGQNLYDRNHKMAIFEQYANIASTAQAVLQHVVCSSVIGQFKIRVLTIFVYQVEYYRTIEPSRALLILMV